MKEKVIEVRKEILEKIEKILLESFQQNFNFELYDKYMDAYKKFEDVKRKYFNLHTSSLDNVLLYALSKNDFKFVIHSTNSKIEFDNETQEFLKCFYKLRDDFIAMFLQCVKGFEDKFKDFLCGFVFNPPNFIKSESGKRANFNGENNEKE